MSFHIYSVQLNILTAGPFTETVRSVFMTLKKCMFVPFYIDLNIVFYNNTQFQNPNFYYEGANRNQLIEKEKIFLNYSGHGQ